MGYESIRRRLEQVTESITRYRPASSRSGIRLDEAQHSGDDSAAHGVATAAELEPSSCALLILGCQRKALEEIDNPDELVMKSNAAVDIMRRHGGLIAFSQIVLSGLEHRLVPATNPDFTARAHDNRFRDGSPAAELHPALAVQPADMLVRQTRLSAFSRTDLDEQLTNLGVTTLLIAGVDTSGVVLSTVRDAADRDYRLIVLSDCTADPDTATHGMVLSRILPRQAELVTVGQMYRQLADGLYEGSASSHAANDGPDPHPASRTSEARHGLV